MMPLCPRPAATDVSRRYVTLASRQCTVFRGLASVFCEIDTPFGASISPRLPCRLVLVHLLYAQHHRPPGKGEDGDELKFNHLIQKEMENSNQVQQDNGNLSIYDRVRTVPKEAMTEIEGGRLKGNSSITPMWRIKKLTEVFGPVGFGWYTEIVRTLTEASESGEMAVFVDINLFVKIDGQWSRPIFGNG